MTAHLEAVQSELVAFREQTTANFDAVFKQLTDVDDERLAGREQLRRLEEFCEKKCA